MKIFLGIIIGILLTILATVFIVAIVSWINNVSMPQQIVNWFDGESSAVIKYTVEQAAAAVARIG